jgi:galactan endo-1,6-beta-galactosidase
MAAMRFTAIVAALAGCAAPTSSRGGSTCTGKCDSDSSEVSTIAVDINDQRGAWEGWGCSLAWWAKAVGDTSMQAAYADAFFTRDDVMLFGKQLPGLGLNIVRYNVGGGGHPGDVADTTENLSSTEPWYKNIEGYWINGSSPDPASPSWDFGRDASQRAMVKAAQDRGVDHIEFFSDTPMWWMKDSKSAAGGRLLAANRGDHAHYLASVARQAQQCGIAVTSVEAFNEPSAGWWTYPCKQEGATIPAADQAEVIAALHTELAGSDIEIAASDENSMKAELATLKTLGDVTDKVNVHGYNGLAPWRDNSVRAMVRAAAGTKRLWMSEYGDNDGSGLTLAQTIVEDVNFLRPSAWVYWQPLEAFSAWGFVNATYGSSATDPARGTPTWVYDKYYVMAQFTRFVRPGNTILGSGDPHTVIAYDATEHTLTFVTLRVAAAQALTYDLVGIPCGATADLTVSGAGKRFETSSVDVVDGHVSVDFPAGTVASLVVHDVTL